MSLYISSQGGRSIEAGDKIFFPVDGLMWHSTIRFVKEHAIAGRFLVVPIAIETFVTELLDFPGKSLAYFVSAFRKPANQMISKPFEAIYSLGISAGYAVATIVSPIYALAKTALIGYKFLLNPLQTAEREACKSDLTFGSWDIIDRNTKKIEVISFLGNKTIYILPENEGGEIHLVQA